MHRLINAFRGKEDPLNEESSPQEESPPAAGDDNGNHINSSMAEITSQEILHRLGICATENPRSYSEEKDIPLIRQTETWDCGLACLQMILLWLRGDIAKDLEGTNADDELMSSEAEKAWMVNFVATKSIWTVDLVMLLQHILTCNRIHPGDKDMNAMQENGSVDSALEIQQQCPCPPKFSYLFCSTKFGVDESYSDLGYYKDAFPSDELRVENLFRVARKQKMPLLQTSRISLQALMDVTSKQGVVAIALLDNRILRSNAIHIASSYSGHYVIICGVSRNDNDINNARMNSPGGNDGSAAHDFCVAIKNPGNAEQVQFITPSIFEKAWRAKGTDEDVIFIAKHILL